MNVNNSGQFSEEFDPRRKYAVVVSASLVHRNESLLTANLAQALDQVFKPVEIVELILQSLLFDGYPCALEGLIALENLVPGILPVDESVEKYSTENFENWKSRGNSLCRRIYGENFERLLQNVEALSPTLREWMLMEGYGRVLARPTLPIDIRELGIISILVVKGYPRQLHSHMRGALLVGVTTAELKTAVELCVEYTSHDKIQSALEIWVKLNSSLS